MNPGFRSLLTVLNVIFTNIKLFFEMLNKILPHHPTIYKYDRTWIGVVLGLLVPTSGILVVYLISVGNHFANGESIVPISTLISNIKSIALLSKFLSVGCILNLGVFFLFLNRNYINISRGVILATMLVAIPVIYLSIRDLFV